jgi:hypothetical protein
VERRREKDGVYDRVAAERAEEMRIQKFQAELKLQDKLENVERVSRVNEFRRLQTLRRIHEQNMRYDDIQHQKETLTRKHLDEVKAALTRKHEISAAMEAMRVSNDFTLLDRLYAKKNKKNERRGKGDDAEAEERQVHTAP